MIATSHGSAVHGSTDFVVALTAYGLLVLWRCPPWLPDGVATGIFRVLSIVIAADLLKGTGRFNLAQGLMALAVGLGAGLSNVVAGYIVQGFGYPAGFLSLAGVALVALVFFWTLMPETRDAAENSSSSAA